MILWLAPAIAACADDTTTHDLLAAAGAADASFASMDLDGFNAHYADAMELLPCLDEVVSPPDAAAVHRMMALHAYVDGDLDGVVLAYHSASVLQPGFSLPTSVAPAGHPLRTAWDQASELPPSPVEQLIYPGLTLVVDGQAGAGVPTQRPAVVQVQQSSGEVLWTAWSAPGAPLPQPIPESPQAPLPRPPVTTSVSVPWLGVGATVALGAAGGAWAYAAAQNRTFDALDTPYEDLSTLQARANSATAMAVGLGAVGVSLGCASFVVEF